MSNGALLVSGSLSNSAVTVVSGAAFGAAAVAARAGATELGGWTLAGAPDGAYLAVSGNEVLLWIRRGTRLLLR